MTSGKKNVLVSNSVDNSGYKFPDKSTSMVVYQLQVKWDMGEEWWLIYVTCYETQEEYSVFL